MWACLCIPRYIHCKVLVAHRHTPMFQLVSCSFSTIPICPFLIQRIFPIYLSPPFLCLLSANYFMRDCMSSLHYMHLILSRMRSCSHVFSVENKMPGGYWSRTGTADLSGALLHQKKWNCAVQEYPSRGRDRDMGSITLTKS